MCGHVKRMRRARSDARVNSRRNQSSICHLLVVAGVDEVTGNSRVIGVSPEERLEQIGRLFLPSVRPRRQRGTA